MNESVTAFLSPSLKDNRHGLTDQITRKPLPFIAKDCAVMASLRRLAIVDEMSPDEHGRAIRSQQNHFSPWADELADYWRSCPDGVMPPREFVGIRITVSRETPICRDLLKLLRLREEGTAVHSPSLPDSGRLARIIIPQGNTVADRILCNVLAACMESISSDEHTVRAQSIELY